VPHGAPACENPTDEERRCVGGGYLTGVRCKCFRVLIVAAATMSIISCYGLQ